MSSDNGGIIGVVNDPTSTVASGVWQQEEQYEAKVNGTWPQRALFTTKSLRFDDGSSDYLTESVSSTSNRRTFTYSTWIKRSSLSGSGYPRLFNPFVNSSNFFDIFFRDTDTLNVYSENGGSNDMNLVTNALFRDLSAWYHIVVAVDTTQGTDSNRVKLYVNGTQETSFSAATYPSQNTDFQINLDTVTNVIGRNQAGSNNYFDGYMSETIFIDGQQLAPTSFGSTNSDGVWIPAIYTGTFGTNGFNLQFENASALGTDSSSNGNNFTVNNLTSIDQSTDYPEVNFATWSPLFGGNAQYATFSEGNLKLDGNNNSNAGCNLNSTIAASSGKYYMEIKAIDIQGNSYPSVGVIMEDDVYISLGQVGGNPNSVSYGPGGQKLINGSTSSYGDTFTDNDIIGIALDLDNGAVYFSKNGTFQASGDPTSGSSRTNAAYTFTASSKVYYFAATVYQSTAIISANFGSPSYAISSGNSDGNGYGNFEYAVPSGYFSLNTANLAEFG